MLWERCQPIARLTVKENSDILGVGPGKVGFTSCVSALIEQILRKHAPLGLVGPSDSASYLAVVRRQLRISNTVHYAALLLFTAFFDKDLGHEPIWM